MAAYVEIVFDNSDGRLSVESDEVVLRRTVGHKKDEFFLNRKRTQKSEVQSLLESAGFSKSNPYFIVQQGKVANLCVMKDPDRLNLLKEVAGTSVYEERRGESLKILEDTTKRQDQMVEVLTFIEERLSELDQEKEELKEYEMLDKNRRALEYNLYDGELGKANDQLVRMEMTQNEERERQQALHVELRAVEDELAQRDDAFSVAKESMDRLVSRRDEKNAEIAELRTRLSSVAVDLQEVDASSKARERERASHQIEMTAVEGNIRDAQEELTRTVDPSFVVKTDALKERAAELKVVQTKVDALYEKQGRGRQFTSIKKRDAFLQTQIDALNEQIAERDELVVRLEAAVAKEEKRVTHELTGLRKSEADNAKRTVELEKLQKSIQEAIRKRSELQESRKDCWRELETIQEKLQEAKHDHEKGKQQLHSTLPRAITSGLATVERLAAEKNLKGYYGPLIDNFELKNEAFRTAVEIAAGNALFHVIVDTDETAATLMKELETRKAGRLTFLPLSRLNVRAVDYPDSPDVRSLLEVAIDYDKDVEMAMRQIFGSILLARDLDGAAHFSKECNLDAVTIEGDVVNRKGGFEGGYHDERSSRIGAVLRMRKAGSVVEKLTKMEKAVQLKAEQSDSNVTDILRELQKLEADRDHVKTTSDQIARDLNARRRVADATQADVDARKVNLETMRQDLKSSLDQVSLYTDELGTPLHGKLSDTERVILRGLEEELVELQKVYQAAEDELLLVSSRRDAIRADLRNNLVRRQQELELLLQGISLNSATAAAETTAAAMAQMRATLELERDQLKVLGAAAERELTACENAVAGRRAEVTKLETAVDEQRVKEAEAQEAMLEAAKAQDKLLNKRTMLLETMAQKQRAIRELGTLPRQEMATFSDMTEKQLLARLKEVNQHLNKYTTVNKKALDQYLSFNEQRDSLIGRRDELTKDRESISELIQSLDHQKDEAILRTFRGVSKNFEAVFSELVPGGTGKLVMKTSMDEEGDEEDGDGDEGDVADKAISTFTGIGVRVAFGSGGQVYKMAELSGGQKALVALAMIFAIQRTDPAPFYLLDEVDAALDATYRSSVAALIKRQAESTEAPAQFITTTFRSELVDVAHKCYGIAVANKVSSIYPLDKADAQSFVVNLMNEEEAVGTVSAVPSYKRAAQLELERSHEAATAAATAAAEDEDEDRPSAGTDISESPVDSPSKASSRAAVRKAASKRSLVE
jgi:structural maintenance of chromosome 3 (chondroitin sulfate proteoglycan 6)